VATGGGGAAMVRGCFGEIDHGSKKKSTEGYGHQMQCKTRRFRPAARIKNAKQTPCTSKDGKDLSFALCMCGTLKVQKVTTYG
jgi:hypothetical protein